jgi:peptide/nickel transport system substrate-binding protein
MIFRKKAVLSTVALLASLAATPVLAQGTLRIGMTASDIPLTTGQTDQGGEGMRFMGYTVYDALINWDLSSADKASVLVPGLATSWKVDEANPTRWTFTLRDGVKFHDGSDFKADAVVWNLDKILNDKSPQFDPKQAAQGRSRIPAVASYKVIDDKTVEITTRTPDAFLPYQISWIMMSSPAQWEKVGKDWNKYAQGPVRAPAPGRSTAFVPREPRRDGRPTPTSGTRPASPSSTSWCCRAAPRARTTRVAALRSGQVDWIEAPAPDADALSLKKAPASRSITNAYPHNWTWHFSLCRGLALERRARAQGGQSRRRPRGHEGTSEAA